MKSRVAALLPVLAAAAPAHAGWSSLGRMPAPQRVGQGLLFRNEHGLVLVTVAPQVVRVRFRPAPELGREHSYAVEGWTIGGDGTVRVRLADRAQAFALTIERGGI